MIFAKFQSLRGLRTNGTKTYVKEIIHCLN